MLRRMLMVLLAVFLCLTAGIPLDCYAEKPALLAADYFAGQEEYSHYVDLHNMMQMRYYAQNDPLWDRIVYESKSSAKFRPFGDGGCCPTSLAIALMRLVPQDQLKLIADYAREPYSLCQHSINQYFCSQRCERFYPTTDEDFERFLPLILADFATGNNTFGVQARTEDKGTAINFIRYVARIYGLKVSTRHTYEEARKALEQDAVVIAYCYRGSSFSNGGHYVALVHADDEYLYVLDPNWREVYDTQFADTLDISDPGVVRVRHEDVRYAKMENLIILQHALQKQPVMRYRVRIAK